MSGFDVENLLPFYLDETDEQIAGLNEMLLQLERSPADEKALREAFRLVHSVKGSATARPSAGRRRSAVSARTSARSSDVGWQGRSGAAAARALRAIPYRSPLAAM